MAEMIESMAYSCLREISAGKGWFEALTEALTLSRTAGRAEGMEEAQAEIDKWKLEAEAAINSYRALEKLSIARALASDPAPGEQVAETRAQLDAGREWMRRAWHEFNAIRARDGAPAGVSEEWWNEITEALGEMLGDDRVPWMTKAAKLLIAPYAQNQPPPVPAPAHPTELGEVERLRAALEQAHAALRLAEKAHHNNGWQTSENEWEAMHAARRAALSKGPTP